ncbi:hypothetical protein ASPCAL08490 [Aspergillus calidoustus]|uniref:Uncharacterized protein n=1 Tax=Aspergillus calidoustus TaxID=454130 RepID=A0A0U5GVG4_ASPCI|nr:hypothetical protein ASPCAL08490 [Aspergillus calidoustus]
MTTAACTPSPVKALLVKSQNKIIFMPFTTKSPANKTRSATVLLLTGPTSIRTESRTLDATQLGEIVHLETIDEATVQFIISAMPKVLEDMHREWFARCKTSAERFQKYVVDLQAAYWVARRGRLGMKFEFED